MKKFLGYTLFLLFILSSCQSDTSNSKSTAASVEDENVYTKVDVKPRFPGCEDQAKEKRAACATSKMFKFIRENIRYPEAAKTEGKEGRAVISFIVDKSGEIREVKLVKDPGSGMGEEALRIVESFSPWTPGIYEGNKVHVQYLIPVTFKL